MKPGRGWVLSLRNFMRGGHREFIASMPQADKGKSKKGSGGQTARSSAVGNGLAFGPYSSAPPPSGQPDRRRRRARKRRTQQRLPLDVASAITPRLQLLNNPGGQTGWRVGQADGHGLRLCAVHGDVRRGEADREPKSISSAWRTTTHGYPGCVAGGVGWKSTFGVAGISTLIGVECCRSSITLSVRSAAGRCKSCCHLGS